MWVAIEVQRKTEWDSSTHVRRLFENEEDTVDVKGNIPSTEPHIASAALGKGGGVLHEDNAEERGISNGTKACIPGLDIGFIMGGCGSRDYQACANYATSIVRNLDMPKTGARVGTVIYSKRSIVLFDFKDNKTDIILQLNTIKYREKPNRALSTGQALELAQKRLFQNARRNSKKIAILVTGEKSQDDVIIPSKLMKDSGVIIYTVGVGEGYFLPQLESIASSPSYVYTEKVKGIGELATRMVEGVCKEKENIATKEGSKKVNVHDPITSYLNFIKGQNEPEPSWMGDSWEAALYQSDRDQEHETPQDEYNGDEDPPPGTPEYYEILVNGVPNGHYQEKQPIRDDYSPQDQYSEDRDQYEDEANDDDFLHRHGAYNNYRPGHGLYSNDGNNDDAHFGDSGRHDNFNDDISNDGNLNGGGANNNNNKNNNYNSGINNNNNNNYNSGSSNGRNTNNGNNNNAGTSNVGNNGFTNNGVNNNNGNSNNGGNDKGGNTNGGNNNGGNNGGNNNGGNTGGDNNGGNNYGGNNNGGNNNVGNNNGGNNNGGNNNGGNNNGGNNNGGNNNGGNNNGENNGGNNNGGNNNGGNNNGGNNNGGNNNGGNNNGENNGGNNNGGNNGGSGRPGLNPQGQVTTATTAPSSNPNESTTPTTGGQPGPNPQGQVTTATTAPSSNPNESTTPTTGPTTGTTALPPGVTTITTPATATTPLPPGVTTPAGTGEGPDGKGGGSSNPSPGKNGTGTMRPGGGGHGSPGNETEENEEESSDGWYPGGEAGIIMLPRVQPQVVFPYPIGAHPSLQRIPRPHRIRRPLSWPKYPYGPSHYRQTPYWPRPHPRRAPHQYPVWPRPPWGGSMMLNLNTETSGKKHFAGMPVRDHGTPLVGNKHILIVRSMFRIPTHCRFGAPVPGSRPFLFVKIGSRVALDVRAKAPRHDDKDEKKTNKKEMDDTLPTYPKNYPEYNNNFLRTVIQRHSARRRDEKRS
ncbi:predicted protein [Nematostella vectensis]|uniref:VWFA domain-containing protein n=1 Tax=Nematostella vectensis TaxID=45351 RepID=A7RPF8_NEMVE|nr:predicted protein [Nematostella vectensis]|eukprot:XP_001638792.1 predicted protein [Nematostella vectensis]